MYAFSAVLTTPAHSPEQPAVVSDLSLHERSRRAHLHHQCSTTTSDTIFYIAPSSCVRGAQISASFHHASRCVNLRSDLTRETTRKVSFNPTSRRSSHLRTDQTCRNSEPSRPYLLRWRRFSAPTGPGRGGVAGRGGGPVPPAPRRSTPERAVGRARHCCLRADQPGGG